MKPRNDAPIERTRSRTTKQDDQPTPLSSQELSAPINGSRKRKREQDLDHEMEKTSKSINADPSTPKEASSPKKAKSEGIPEEKRSRRFRAYAPATYLQKLERATSQRFATHSPPPGISTDTTYPGCSSSAVPAPAPKILPKKTSKWPARRGTSTPSPST
ncbi:MAG: hypothetical protein Q9174_004697 [Haloplaca sp. 1 TL-2023]